MNYRYWNKRLPFFLMAHGISANVTTVCTLHSLDAHNHGILEGVLSPL
jgi:hypothetical protein